MGHMSKSDAVQYSLEVDPIMPNSIRNQREFDVLRSKVKAAILEGQFGATLPISLGYWVEDMHIKCIEAFPRHKFTWDNGEILYRGDPVQAVHAVLSSGLVDSVMTFCRQGSFTTEYSISYSNTLRKMPHISFSHHATNRPATVVEIAWGNEAFQHLINEVNWSSEAGLNTIAVKAYFNGHSGNAATLAHLENLHAGAISQRIVDMAGVIVIIKAAGKMSPTQFFSSGQVPAMPYQITPASTIWLSSVWFKGGEERSFPFDITYLREKVVMGIWRDAFGTTAADWYANDRALAHRHRLLEAIDSGSLDEAKKTRLHRSLRYYYDDDEDGAE
ncbi:unnamed protein product [Sympodiomycopsis kandeliae]